jgi:hypothetical protein
MLMAVRNQINAGLPGAASQKDDHGLYVRDDGPG